MPEFYYHCTSVHLENDSIIKPGNWGRIVSMYGKDFPGTWEVLYRETCFEYVRKLDFPTKPSRMNGMFLCRSKEEIEFFKIQNKRFIDVIYKVKILDNTKPIHMANWGQVAPANLGQEASIVKSMEVAAKAYWNNSNIDHGTYTECLVESPVQVVEIY